MKKLILQVIFAVVGFSIAIYIAIAATQMWSDYYLPRITSHEKFLYEQMWVFGIVTLFGGSLLGYLGVKLGSWLFPKASKDDA